MQVFPGDHPLFIERFPQDGRDIDWVDPEETKPTLEGRERMRRKHLMQLVAEIRQALNLGSDEEAADIVRCRKPLPQTPDCMANVLLRSRTEITAP